MYGRELGTLNVYQKVGNSLGKPIFSKTGDAGLGRTWIKGQATLNSTDDFMVSRNRLMTGNCLKKKRINRYKKNESMDKRTNKKEQTKE